MRAPQYRRVITGIRSKPILPEGPNPAATAPLRVEPFGSIYALVEGLGVISLHRTPEEGKTALEAELERRSRVVKDKDAVATPQDDDGSGVK